KISSFDTFINDQPSKNIINTTGNPATILAVCNVSSPPINIKTRGNNVNENAQNRRFHLNGSESTFFCTTDHKLNDAESNVVDKTIIAKIVKIGTINFANGN